MSSQEHRIFCSGAGHIKNLGGELNPFNAQYSGDALGDGSICLERGGGASDAVEKIMLYLKGINKRADKHRFFTAAFATIYAAKEDTQLLEFLSVGGIVFSIMWFFKGMRQMKFFKKMEDEAKQNLQYFGRHGGDTGQFQSNM